jgi:hypothetical protein
MLQTHGRALVDFDSNFLYNRCDIGNNGDVCSEAVVAQRSLNRTPLSHPYRREDAGGFVFNWQAATKAHPRGRL